MKKTIRLMLVALLSSVLLTCSLPAAAYPGEDASITPSESSSPVSGEEHGMGLLPSEQKLRFGWEFSRAALQSEEAALPDSYGFTVNPGGKLNVSDQSGVRDQKASGICLFYRGTAAVESYLMKHGRESGFGRVSRNIDLSEIHGAYSTTVYGLSETDYANLRYGENNWIFSNGGTDNTWIGYAMRGGPLGGMVPESADPEIVMDQPAAFRYLPLTMQRGRQQTASVQNIHWLTKTVKWWEDDSEMRAHWITPIQQGIMDSGSVMTSMYYLDAYYNEDTCSYYTDKDHAPNHAVLIVGWDDNYSKEHFAVQPEGDGAWLIKNSWGTDWGLDGYFWASYYDLHILSDAFCIEGIRPFDADQVVYDAAPSVNNDSASALSTTTQTTNPIAELYGIYPKQGTGIQTVESLRIGFRSPAAFELYIDPAATPCAPADIDVSGFTPAGTFTVAEPGYWTLPLEDPVEITGDFLGVYIRLQELPDGSMPDICVDKVQMPWLAKGVAGDPPTFEYDGTDYEYTFMREKNDGSRWHSVFEDSTFKPDSIQSSYCDTLLPAMKVLAGSLEVMPEQDSMAPGMTQTLRARRGGLFKDSFLTWSITGRTSTDTFIRSSGKLSVGADEEAEELTVKVSARVNNTEYANSKVIRIVHDKLILTDENGDLLTDWTYARAKAEKTGKLTVTVKNTGDELAENVTVSGEDNSDFVVSTSSLGTIEAGGRKSFTVVPRKGLTPGEYTETLTVSDEEQNLAFLNLTVPVCAELKLEKDSLIGNMTGEKGLYLPGEAVGVSAAGLKDSVICQWTANGEATPSLYSFSHKIASPGTPEDPYFIMPAEDVTLRAVGARPVPETTNSSVARGGTTTLKVTWRSGDGAETNYNERCRIAAILDQSGNDIRSYVSHNAGSGMIPGNEYSLTVSPNLPRKVTRIRLRLEGQNNILAGAELILTVPANAPSEGIDPGGVPSPSPEPQSDPEADNPVPLFPDVTEDRWSFEAVSYVAGKGLFLGYDDGLFHPTDPMTRGMLMAVLARYFGADASGSDWMQKGIVWSVRNGISDGTYPARPITREELVTMLWRSIGSPVPAHRMKSHADIKAASSWSRNALAWAVKTKVIRGDEQGRLHPRQIATREEVAQVLINLTRYM